MTLTRKQDAREWHVGLVETVFEALNTSETGLSQGEVERRRQEYGPNVLPERGPTPLWRIVLRQFVSPLIYILVAAAVVSALIGDLKDAAFIAVVLMLNAVIGAWQEWQAEQSSHALKKLLRMHALVERDGEAREVMAEDVVPGDVLWLESGNRVPADTRLLSAQGLEVYESLLTGESLAVRKDADWRGDQDATLADRQNMAFAGSLVARGRAKGIVVSTGTATSVGQLALDVMGSSGGKPPLLDRMERFTNYVAVGTLAAAAAIGTLGIVLGGYTLTETFFFVVALAVSAIPEGLPVAITVALAVATTRMARRNVIVRQLTAVEGLGSCTLIATDKTGTLTCNELTVREVCLANGEVFPVTGQGFSPHGEVLHAGSRAETADHSRLSATIRAAVLCNEAELHQRNGGWAWRGDAVDIAALSLGVKSGMHREQVLDAFPQVNSIPFEPEHQFAASYHRSSERVEVFVKGAPERVLDMCGDQLSQADRRRLDQVATGMAARGLRVLAVASGRLAESPRPGDVPPRPGNLTLHGFLGMIDPLRAGAREAVADCHRAGVMVSMVTGDHRVTALAIARELGLADRDDQVVTAADIDGKSVDELAGMVQRVRVFARVTPRQKLQIVEAARKAGHFVAVTGDGVNDAPALATAHIGVAMGGAGSDVALETADVVLMGDDLRKLPFAVQLGRAAQSAVRTNIAVALGVAVVLIVAAVAGWVQVSQAVLLHEGSTVFVVVNGLRMLWFRDD